MVVRHNNKVNGEWRYSSLAPRHHILMIIISVEKAQIGIFKVPKTTHKIKNKNPCGKTNSYKRNQIKCLSIVQVPNMAQVQFFFNILLKATLYMFRPVDFFGGNM